MSKDRTVATDALETLGSIIDENQKRDAIHLAVEPVIAGEDMSPGSHVGLFNGIAYLAKRPMGSVTVKDMGIVDPFLEYGPQKGERFWLVVHPRQITSLRHVWSHPDFAEADVFREEVPMFSKVSEESRAASERWIRNFIDQADCPPYETLIAAASGEEYPGTGDLNIEDHSFPGYYRWEKTEDYLHFGGSDAHGEIPDEFWVHLENVTGKKFGPDERPGYFSCSC